LTGHAAVIDDLFCLGTVSSQHPLSNDELQTHIDMI